MADTKLISTLLSHSDMESILTAVKTYVDKLVEKAGGDTTAVANLLNAVIGADDKAGALENQKTIRTISAEEVAKIVANADASYDTLKEIADWIMSDTTGAAKMAADILKLQGYVGEPADGETAATGLFKAIADEKTRAEGAEKGLSDRLDVIEGEGEGSVKKALADANEYTDGLKVTVVSSTKTSGPVTVTLGGTVGAPTVDVTITMATADEVKTLTDIFAVAED